MMKTHFPKNRERIFSFSKKKEILGFIHTLRRNRFRAYHYPVAKKYYNKKQRLYGMVFIVLLLIWLPFVYFFGAFISQIFMMISISLLLRIGFKEKIWEGFRPFFEINEKGVFFNDFSARWEEIIKIHIKVQTYRVRLKFFLTKGNVIKFIEHNVWEIADNVKAFKKKYRQPYVYMKK